MNVLGGCILNKMTPEEAIQKQKKALEILSKNKMGSAFRWILANHLKWSWYKNKNVKQLSGGSFNEDFGYEFTYKNNKYKIERVNTSTGYYPSGSYTSGKFVVHFNDEIVFVTNTFQEDDGTWQCWWTTDEIDGKTGSITCCKLGDWVKDLPHFTYSEKIRFEEERKKEDDEYAKLKDNKIIEDTNKKYDLGDFEE